MKGYIFPLAMLLFACNSGEANEQKITGSEKEKKADTLVTIENETVIPMKKIKIQVMYTSSYCGGTPPNKEILAEMHKKRWYQNSIIRIFSNTGDLIIIPVQTNHEGIAEVELMYGTYSVQLDTTRDEQMSHLFNPKCREITDKKWKHFTVSENGLNGPDPELLWIEINFPCDPCDPTIKMRP